MQSGGSQRERDTRWVSSTICFKRTFVAHRKCQISDLNRLIRMYQYWAHQMYPRQTFNDTIERVERLTHSRRMHVWLYISCRSMLLDLMTPDMQVALGVWHDEARGISRHQAHPEESIDIDRIDSDGGEDQAEPSGPRQTSERPPSSASEQASGPDDDFHMDCAPGTKPSGAQGARDEFDFEVEMWDDTPFADGLTSTSANPTNPTTNPPKPLTKSPALPFNQDEDQDMWDLVGELQVQAGRLPNENTVPPGEPPAPVDDDDWDSIYA